MTFWDKVIEFNKNLYYKWKLPEKFSVLNPYLDNPETIIVMQEFYKKYYNPWIITPSETFSSELSSNNISIDLFAITAP